MATITDKVTEALVGTTEEPQLTQQSRSEFLSHAVKDPETGEHYMDEEHFINAVAPASEDYVRTPMPPWDLVC
jgi:solute carrier family 25 aspartate/glutamate transporter 12/13